MNSTFVILDSSALIAQINVKDLWHKKANTISAFIERTNRKVILPAEVLAETLNRIGNNIGKQDAVLAGNALLERNETGDLLIIHSNTGPRSSDRPLSSYETPEKLAAHLHRG